MNKRDYCDSVYTCIGKTIQRVLNISRTNILMFTSAMTLDHPYAILLYKGLALGLLIRAALDRFKKREVQEQHEKLDEMSRLLKNNFIDQKTLTSYKKMSELTTEMFQYGSGMRCIYKRDGEPVGYTVVDHIPDRTPPPPLSNELVLEGFRPGSPRYLAARSATKGLVEFLTEEGVRVGLGCRLLNGQFDRIITANHVYAVAHVMRPLGVENKLIAVPEADVVYNDVAFLKFDNSAMTHMGFTALKSGPLTENSVFTLIGHDKGRLVRAVGAAGPVLSGPETPFDFEHQISSDEGDSGTPLLTKDRKVVAIHRAKHPGYNVAVALEPLIRIIYGDLLLIEETQRKDRAPLFRLELDDDYWLAVSNRKNKKVQRFDYYDSTDMYHSGIVDSTGAYNSDLQGGWGDRMLDSDEEEGPPAFSLESAIPSSVKGKLDSLPKPPVFRKPPGGVEVKQATPKKACGNTTDNTSSTSLKNPSNLPSETKSSATPKVLGESISPASQGFAQRKNRSRKARKQKSKSLTTSLTQVDPVKKELKPVLPTQLDKSQSPGPSQGTPNQQQLSQLTQGLKMLTGMILSLERK